MGYDLKQFVETVGAELSCKTEICGIVLPMEDMQAHLIDCKRKPLNQGTSGICECRLCTNKGNELVARLDELESELESTKQKFDKAIDYAICEYGLGAKQEYSTELDVLSLEALETERESVKQDSDEAVQNQVKSVICEFRLGASGGNETELDVRLESLKAVAESSQELDKGIANQAVSAMYECKLCTNKNNELNARLDALEAELDCAKQKFDEAIKNQVAYVMCGGQIATELEVRLKALETELESREEFDKAMENQGTSAICECSLCIKKENELDARLEALETELESAKQDFDKARVDPQKGQHGLTDHGHQALEETQSRIE